MKIVLVGDRSNSALYGFTGMLEAYGLNPHRYMVNTTNGGQLSINQVTPDEMVAMVESEDGLVLKSTDDNKWRATMPSAIEKSDFITITPDQIYELADLLPDESIIIVLVTEGDVSHMKDEDMSETDRKLQDMFGRFTEEISGRAHAAAVYKLNPWEMDCTRFAEYISNKKKSHDNLATIVWQLIESGNIKFVGDIDTDGHPLRHDRTYKVLQYEMDKEVPTYVPVDLFTSNVMYDPEGFVHTMRIWLESGVDVTGCCKTVIDRIRRQEESGDEVG